MIQDLEETVIHRAQNQMKSSQRWRTANCFLHLYRDFHHFLSQDATVIHLYICDAKRLYPGAKFTVLSTKHNIKYSLS